ncbi:MAG: Xylulose-5-phosphate phosphoketolase @ Fructose-6-phosphate phosphoketolase, partial [uncultured Thermoleophilia bacterium]
DPPRRRRRRARRHRRLLARRQLPERRADLPDGQPAAARAAQARAREAAPARPLGHDAGAEPDVRPRQPLHRRARPRRDLRDGP